MKAAVGLISLANMLLAGLLAACDAGLPEETPVPENQVRAITLLESDIHLPASATDVWRYERRALDASQMLRFDAPLDDARQFARLVLNQDPVPGQDPIITAFGQDHEWWLREFPAGAEGGRSSGDRHVWLVLLPMGDSARIWILASAD